MSRVRTVVGAEVALLLGLPALVAAAWLIERGFGLEALALGRAGSALVAVAPALIWLGYVTSQERREAAAKTHVVGTFLVGAFLAGPVGQYAIDLLLAPHAAAAAELDPLATARVVRAFLVIAVAQELAKLAVVRYGVYRTGELDAPLDGIVYLTAAGLGYGAYLTFSELSAGGGEVYLSVAATTTARTALAHACFAAVLGFFVGQAKFKAVKPIRRAVHILAGLGLAIALNGQFLVVQGALSASGLTATPWRSAGYAFGFAALVFVAVSFMIRRLGVGPGQELA